jgi:hypothetical protein
MLFGARLVAINECNYAEIGRGAPNAARDRNRLNDEIA